VHGNKLYKEGNCHKMKGIVIKYFAGTTQWSPKVLFAGISALIILIVSIILMKYQLTYIVSYFIAINITTFLMYGYDKKISSSNLLRVPEQTLHLLAVFGGTFASLIAQKFFRHKTLKGSFQIVFWLIFIVQIIVVWFLNKNYF